MTDGNAGTGGAANAGADAGDKAAGTGAANGGAGAGAAGAGANGGAGAGDTGTGTGDKSAVGTGAGDGAGAGQQAAPDWRKDMAGDDEKALKNLERFASPAEVYKSLAELRSKIGSGELRGKLPDNPTAEQLTEYRKQNGIPEKADAYADDKALAELKLSPEDRTALQPLFEKLHGLNVPPAAIAAGLAIQRQNTEAQLETLRTNDLQIQQQTEDALRDQWKGDYRPNMNAAKAFIEGNFPKDIQETLLEARLGDGTPMMHNVSILKAFAQVGRFMNPAGVVTPTGDDSMKSAQEQIAIYKKRMGNDPNWHKDTAANEHYMQLVRMTGGTGAGTAARR